MFFSEVTVFFDRDYYGRFYNGTNFLPDNKRPSRIFSTPILEGFSEFGYMQEWEEEFDDGEIVEMSEERWTIGQPL